MRIPHSLRIAALILVAAGAQPANASCWQWAKSASSNATADPSINWSEGMAPSAVNDSARAMMARLAECRDDLSGVLQASGGPVAYAVTTNQGLNAIPVDGQSIAFRLNVTNGAAATLAADGGTIYAIQTSPGVAVPTGALVAGTPYRVTFNLSATAWVLQDFYSAPIPVGSVTYSQIQNVTANRLLGNPTGSAASMSEIPLGTNLVFSGGSLNAVFNGGPSFQGYLSGLILSTAGSSATFGIAVGAAMDNSNTQIMVLASAFTKTTSAWAVGTGNGGLDTSTIAINTSYHVFLMERPDTGVVDVCFSVTVTACTTGGNIPVAYTLFRRIGSIKTDGAGQWVKFTQTGDQIIWAASSPDRNTSGSSSRVTFALGGVPPGVVTTALMRVTISCGGGVSMFSLYTSLLENDQAPTSTLFDLGAPTSGIAAVNIARIVDTSRQIAVRSDSANCVNSVGTYGYIDTRGKN